jgi:Choline/Carnitine o-acyltransferase
MSAPPQSARSFQRNGSSNASGITYASQSKLPRLPIPDLEETLIKFQATLDALQDESQREETRNVVQEFSLTSGPVLQSLLQRYEREGLQSGTIGSYVEEFWDESYLSPDSSVVLNLNPFFVLEGGPDPKSAQDQLRRAASLCFASLKMASMLKHETLTPDTFRGTPLCMDQFKALFGSSRQPSLNDADEVHLFTDSTHGMFPSVLLCCYLWSQIVPTAKMSCCSCRTVQESILLFFCSLARHLVRRCGRSRHL